MEKFLTFMIASTLLFTVTSALNMYNLYADMNMGGIKGTFLFQQENKLKPVTIKVQTNTSESGPWAIHEYPFIYNKDAATSCSNIGNIIEGGNLTAKHGIFGYKSTYVDATLRLFGNETLLARTLAIYYPDSLRIRACANIIEFNTTMLYAAAVLHEPVSGKVMFLQSAAANNPTIIFGELYHVDGKTVPTDNYEWFVGSSAVGSYSNCGSVGGVLGSSSASASCSIYSHENCAQGDLTGKHGNISVGIAGSDEAKRRRFRFVDLNLQISQFLTAAKGLAIKMNGNSVACGDIINGGPMTVEAMFDATKHSGVSGSVSFSQISPFHPTTINVALNGLSMQANGYHVHDFPIPYPMPTTEPCSPANVGAHLNPFSIDNTAPSYPAPGKATTDFYEIGDISGKFGTLVNQTDVNVMHNDAQMPLYGRHNILGRALVIHRNDQSGSRWVCANIMPKDSVKLSARTDFAPTSELTGYIDLEQYVQSNGIRTETGITVSLSYKNGSMKTMDHNWHVHIDPVGSDYAAEISKRCTSVKAHYNPYKVNTEGNYHMECIPAFPHRCELGDISMKQAKYSVGGGKKYFVDVDVPLIGATTVFGRSITVHEANGAGGRLACADIVAIQGPTAQEAQFKFSGEKGTVFSASNFAKDVASAIGVAQWQVNYAKIKPISENGCNKMVTFYLIEYRKGKTAKQLKDRFLQVDRSKLGAYKTCGASRSIAGDMRLFIFATLCWMAAKLM